MVLLVLVGLAQCSIRSNASCNHMACCRDKRDRERSKYYDKYGITPKGGSAKAKDTANEEPQDAEQTKKEQKSEGCILS